MVNRTFLALTLLVGFAHAEVVADSSISLACEKNADQVYKNEKHGFTLCPPTGWKTDDSGMLGTLVLFSSWDGIDAQQAIKAANIGIVVEPVQDIDLDGYVAAAKELYPKVVKEYKLVAEEKIDCKDNKAILLQGVITFEGGQKINNAQLILIKNGSAYVVTGSAHADSWDSHKDAIMAALKSFSFC